MPSSRAPRPALPAVATVITLLTAGAAHAQVPRAGAVRPPIAIQGSILDSNQDPREDPGRPVQMLESPNIDRFLRKAQEQLGRGDYEAAIRVLQDVIEGRTLVDPTATETTAGATDQDPAQPAPEGDVWDDLIESAENAVFSDDLRLYHPVRRLCHELLASLPPEGVQWYRTRFEVEAERALATADAGSEPRLFEAVYDHFFLTLAAGRAMLRAGDALMDQGRLRGAIQAYRLLLDVYPGDARREIGIDDAWVRFRVALCFGLIGETARAREELGALAAEAPNGALRVEGELVAIAEMPNLAVFGHAASGTRATEAVSVLRSADETLVPLFEYRYADQAPYRPAKGATQNQRVVFVDGGAELTAAPNRNDFVPGTSVTFDGDRITFLDNFQLEIAGLPDGRVIARNDGIATVPDPQPGAPRSRIPAYDFASLRVAQDESRYFVVVGPGGSRLPGMKPVTRNFLEAWRRDDLAPLWSTRDRPAYDDVTFLATPTVFGARLLVPTIVKGTFGVMCFESATGEQVYHVALHRDGTDMTRPPAVPVAIASGTAYVLTNAGALGAIDAFTGTVRWIRRYERTHPFRPASATANSRRRPDVFGGNFYQELPLYGFAPSDIVVSDGLVVIAPCDGGVLICVDGASGEPVWMNERDSMQYVIGADDDHLYVGGPDEVDCIRLRSGVRLWRESLPPHPSSSRWRGRGLVAAGMLMVPGERAILVRRLEAKSPWATLRLPTLLPGREPLTGEFNLYRDGAYLAAVFEGGFEMLSSAEALSALADRADDPFRRAGLQAQAGDLVAAVATLESVDLAQHPELRGTVSVRLLALCGELSLAFASHGARDEALAMLDRCRDRLTENQLVQRWHLARIEVFQALGDLDAVATEQETLYDLMGKRG